MNAISSGFSEPLPPQIEERAFVPAVFLTVLLALLIAGFLFWAASYSLSIVSVAVGEVKPSSRVKEIQHLEGGIIEEILGREGQRVAAGEALFTLSPTRGEADLAELQARLTNLRIDRARLTAEVGGAEAIVFPDGLADAAPGAVEKARALFTIRMQQAETEAARFAGTVEQRRQDVREIQTRLASNRESLALLNQQVEISADLLQKGITNRYTHLELQREQQKLTGGIAQDVQAVKGARAALAASEREGEEARLEWLQRARGTLSEVEAELSELSQRLKKFEDAVRRTTIRAPVAGIVKEIMVGTEGGVIRPGEIIAAIVPEDDSLIVEASLAPQEIGYVRAGQRAVIRLNSADLVRFGHIEGTVSEVSPDRLTSEDGTPYFRVRISAGQGYFEAGDARYDLYPGTQVIANIQTGERTVLDYITAPLLDRGRKALMER